MATKRPVCKYGAECYRKNPDHMKNYYHPPKADKESKVIMQRVGNYLARSITTQRVQNLIKQPN